MTAEKNYLKALRHGATSEELARLEQSIVAEKFTDALNQCCAKPRNSWPPNVLDCMN